MRNNPQAIKGLARAICSFVLSPGGVNPWAAEVNYRSSQSECALEQFALSCSQPAALIPGSRSQFTATVHLNAL